MPSYFLNPLKRTGGILSPLARGSSSSPRNSEDAAAVSELGAGDEAKEEEPVVEDVLDMRDHDEMIKGTIKTMENVHVQPKNLFGVRVWRAPAGGLKVEIQDEVRFGVWAGALLLLLTGIIFLIVVAVRDDVNFSDSTTHPHGTAVIIAGVFVLLSCFITAYQIYKHVTHWTHPPSQRLVLRILLMVPVYSIAAWLALLELEYSTYIDFVRVCYEAFTLYTFMVLLTQYLGGHAGVVEWMQVCHAAHYKEPIKWVPPFCCFKPCEPNSNFLWYLKYSCLQYAVFAPIAMLIGVICESVGEYGDGELNVNQGYLWVTVLINCTQLTSLYALAWLYVIMKKELMPFSPVFKFLVIKSVVFFTFWQGVGLAVLVRIGAINDSDNFSVGQIQVGLQDFIICIEMFIAACCHKYAFGYETYSDGSMALLMEQRATFIAQLAYKRAVDAARKELEAREAAEKQDKLGAKSTADGYENGDGNHSIDIEKKEAASASANGSSGGGGKLASLTSAERDDIISTRAKEIIAENAVSEEVLFDDRAMKRALPANHAETEEERVTRREEKELVDNEMVRETTGERDRSRSRSAHDEDVQREHSRSDQGEHILDSEES